MTKECDSPEEELPQAAALRRNLEKLRFEMNSVNEGIQSYILARRTIGTWGPSRYLIEGEENVSESDGGEIEKVPISIVLMSTIFSLVRGVTPV